MTGRRRRRVKGGRRRRVKGGRRRRVKGDDDSDPVRHAVITQT